MFDATPRCPRAAVDVRLSTDAAALVILFDADYKFERRQEDNVVSRRVIINIVLPTLQLAVDLNRASQRFDRNEHATLYDMQAVRPTRGLIGWRQKDFMARDQYCLVYQRQVTALVSDEWIDCNQYCYKI